MGLFLNPGNLLFQETLNSEIYVDKSGIIAHLNSRLGTSEKYICISRPRRFGKTTTAQMLAAYYGRTCDSRPQFESLSISSDPTFETHLNRYDVVHLNIQNFLSENRSMDDMLSDIERQIKREILAEHTGIDLSGDDSLALLLARSHAATGIQFVFVIDEWDSIFRTHRSDHDAQTRYLDWLRNLLKDRAFLALAYMTGILPIKKYGQHSALNMFDEVSMANAWPIAEYTGFTAAEVAALCERYGRDANDVRDWYDGYLVNGIETYNPRSVVKSVMSGIFDSYWTRTETFRALSVYIEMDFDGLRGRIAELIAGARIPVNTLRFQNDMTSLASADDVLTLLVHLGYLTYDFDTKMAWIPNREIQGEFENCMEDHGWEMVMDAINASGKLVAAALAGDADKVAEGIEAAHRENASILKYNDENALACVTSLAFYTARRTHKIVREMPAGEGFADLVFIPKPGVDAPGMVVELKRGGTPVDAIAQIRDRKYAESLSGIARKVLLVGISYDPDTKKHSCIIEPC